MRPSKLRFIAWKPKMTTVSSGKITARGLTLPACFTVMLLLPFGQAQAHPLYDTTRLLREQGNACVGAKGCRLIASEPRRIKAGRVAEITAHCPDARPYLVNWDASFHEHIGVRLAERRPGLVTVVATNQADTTGRVKLIIGCASNPPGPTVECRPWVPCRPGP